MMKAKQKNLIRERSYYSYLLTCLSNAFKWTLPDTVEERYVERYLHETGNIAVKKDGDGYIVVSTPSRAGNLNQYGDGMDIQGATCNGKDLRGTLGIDVAICYNNSDRIPDLDLIRYADAFSQIDKSIMANVHWTILAPVLCASDSKTADSISRLTDDMLDGKLKCITSKDVLESLSGGNGTGVYSVDITHPERIKNVQYQSELYDVLLRRFFNKYGLNIQNSSKHAQVSTDEVHGLDSVSWVYILDMLKQRKEFCDECNRIWNDGWKCEFSEVWQLEYNMYKQRTTTSDMLSETTDESEVNKDDMDEN